MKINLPGQGPCILIVDDHDISRQHAVKALRQMACPVKQAGSGREALDMALRFLPELVFLDLHLPDTNGLALLEEIRRAWPPGKPEPSFVILSGCVPAELQEKFRQTGVAATLLKPLTAARLRAVAARHLPSHPGVSEIPAPADPAVPDVHLREKFIHELKSRLPELDANIANLDWEAATEITHQLIASSAICGEKQFERSCRSLHQCLSNSPELRETAATYCALLDAVEQSRLSVQAL